MAIPANSDTSSGDIVVAEAFRQPQTDTASVVLTNSPTPQVTFSRQTVWVSSGAVQSVDIIYRPAEVRERLVRREIVRLLNR